MLLSVEVQNTINAMWSLINNSHKRDNNYKLHPELDKLGFVKKYCVRVLMTSNTPAKECLLDSTSSGPPALQV